MPLKLRAVIAIPVLSAPVRSRCLTTLVGPCRHTTSSIHSFGQAHPSAFTRPLFPPTLFRRAFHPTRRRQDVFFVSFPALKSGLLTITRFSLLFLPFVFRYKLWRKYRRTSLLLIQIPIFAICVVLALGLDQAPHSGRWRLLLMSEHEELAWSRRKHQEVLHNDGPLLLPPSHPLSQKVVRVVTRLVTALEEEEHTIVCSASWPPRSSELGRVIAEREAGPNRPRGDEYKPSGTAQSTFMPFRPITSNPLKKLESADWNLYVIDSPQINAFALPSKDVFVYTGLLKALPDDDAMLAAILGHEIAHVAERHSVENMGFLNLAAVAFDVLRGISFALTISFPFVTDSAALFINWLNDVVAQRAYSRKLEMEADKVGLDLMALAGYDPRAGLDLWEFMAAVEADAAAAGQPISIQDRLTFLRTHPTSETRHQALQGDLDGAMRLWRQSKGKFTVKAHMSRVIGRAEEEQAIKQIDGEGSAKEQSSDAVSVAV
ncbi:peptidase family M48-domain-containing protein [Naematelia encephala]|uniref:Peptidase family M48-domain-containing protein n=1 Tax=Naematelia encephala TaxID=71784 RepID=A0A1Y2BG80_9TREE|nr:peptidase family M48-domain-containing protein [Naematelia encephala]